MNAAVLHRLGEPPRYESFPEPTPCQDEVIVHVRAASLKPADKARASGSHYSRPGALPAVVPRSRCFPLPEAVDDDTAAAVFNPGLSAWAALSWRAQLAAGETV